MHLVDLLLAPDIFLNAAFSDTFGQIGVKNDS